MLTVKKAVKVSVLTSSFPSCRQLSAQLQTLQPRRRRIHVGRGGFTLLELLTVLIIVGVLAGAIVLSYTGSTQSRMLHTHAERLMLAIELARQQSTIQNEILGVKLRRDTYEFLRLQADQKWQVINATPLQPRSLGTEHSLLGRLLGNPASSTNLKFAAIEPEIVIYPSGEVSPFEVTLTNRSTGSVRYVTSDGIGRAIVSNVPYQAINESNED